MTKLYLSNDGDSSVGIPPSHTEIDLCFEIPFKDKSERAEIAKIFLDIFRELWDGGPLSHCYDDECSICGSPLTKEGEIFTCEECRKNDY